MTLVYGFTTLDDAHWFLNQAKGLPDIASAKSLRERYVRACVVLSWIALEESLDAAIKILRRQSTLTDDVPQRLRDRLQLVMRTVGHGNLDSGAFKRARTPRNELVHPKTGRSEPSLSVEQAARVFDYCENSIRTFFPHQIELDLEARSEGSGP